MYCTLDLCNTSVQSSLILVPLVKVLLRQSLNPLVEFFTQYSLSLQLPCESYTLQLLVSS